MAALEKMYIPLEDDAWHGIYGEWLWVKKLKEDKFKINNSPFYAYGLSYQDVVSVKIVDCPSSYKMAQVSARAKRDFAHLFG